MGSSGNFATLNPLNTRGSSASTQITQNNLQYNGQSTQDEAGCTINVGNDGVPKVYFEMYIINNHDTGWVGVYDTKQLTLKDVKAYGTSSYRALLVRSTQKVTGSTTSNYIGDGSDNNSRSGQTIGVAIDVPNQKIWFAVNDAWGGDGASDPSDSNYAFNDLSATGSYDIVTHMGGASVAQPDWCFNFGQDSTFQGRETAGGNTDENGFGDFRYAPPSGFVALCTGNVNVGSGVDPNQTDTNIGEKQVGAVTYTGNGTSVNVTGFGFQPDLVWIKMRSPHGYNNMIFDSSRGVHKHLSSDRSATEFTSTNSLTAFGTDGFTYGNEASGNDSGDSHIAWGWKANGGTTSTNTDGTITSTVQANQDAGFSIVTFTGVSTNTTATVGHGLGKAPEAIMHFCRTSATYPLFRIKGATSASTLRNTNPNGSPVDVSSTSDGGAISDPTSTVFSINNYVGLGGCGFDYVAYCWAPIQGYSSFGNFIGNGNADGPFIYTGFKPRTVVLIGEQYGRENFIFDSTRNTHNVVNTYLRWGRTSVEADGTTQHLDFLSNGFKISGTFGGDINGDGENCLYMAWGDVPFKYNNTHP